jgi:hypothetical protein
MDRVTIPDVLTLVEPVGWALPTDHVQLKQKEFKLFDLITYSMLHERIISTEIDPTPPKYSHEN